MNCIIHRKVIIGGCFWCGKSICNHCVTASSGNRYYCGKCSSQLDTLLKRKLPPIELMAEAR